MKVDNSNYKETTRRIGCDPHKLKQHIVNHFNRDVNEKEPIELIEAPDFIKKLQDIRVDGMETIDPGFDELRAMLNSLKNGKAANDIPAGYLKYAERSVKFVNEMLNIYNTVWSTHHIPKFWGHSKLVSMWKEPSKGSIKDPTTSRGLQIGSTLCKIMIIIIINLLKILVSESTTRPATRIQIWKI